MKDSFEDFLKIDFERRRASDPSLSLRSYARFLQIDSTALSRILAGSRKISPPTYRKLASRLSLTDDEHQYFLNCVERNSYRKSRLPYKKLEDFESDGITKWHQLALLELPNTKGFEADLQWISRRLCLEGDEVEAALADLQRVGLIIRDSQNPFKWKELDNSFSNTPDVETSEQRKNLQTHLFSNAVDAIDRVEISYRSHTSTVMPVKIDRMPELKNLIKNFQRRLAEFSQDDDGNDEVYQLSIALCPLTSVEKETEHSDET